MTQDHEIEYAERLTKIEVMLTEVYHRLIGNGEIGLTTKIDELEKFKNKISGALMIVSVATTILGGALAYHMINYKP